MRFTAGIDSTSRLQHTSIRRAGGQGYGLTGAARAAAGALRATRVWKFEARECDGARRVNTTHARTHAPPPHFVLLLLLLLLPLLFGPVLLSLQLDARSAVVDVWFASVTVVFGLLRSFDLRLLAPEPAPNNDHVALRHSARSFICKRQTISVAS